MKTCGQTRKHCFRNKNVSEFVGKHFCFLGSKFCFCNNVPEVGKQGNIDRKHNVSATMFPSLPGTLCKCSQTCQSAFALIFFSCQQVCKVVDLGQQACYKLLQQTRIYLPPTSCTVYSKKLKICSKSANKPSTSHVQTVC